MSPTRSTVVASPFPFPPQAFPLPPQLFPLPPQSFPMPPLKP